MRQVNNAGSTTASATRTINLLLNERRRCGSLTALAPDIAVAEKMSMLRRLLASLERMPEGVRQLMHAATEMKGRDVSLLALDHK